MCGRFAFFSPREAVQEYFGIEVPFALEPRYNVAPSQQVAVIRQPADTEPEAAMLKWGLVPFWAKDAAIGARMINARAETVAQKPAFRQAFKRRRCVILADGFYEWHTEDGRKTPYFISLKTDRPFAMAGLWESWDKTDQPPLETCAIITTTASKSIGKLHDRMPVILDAPTATDWIQAERDSDALIAMLKSYDDEDIQAWPVNRTVNNPVNQGATLIERAD
jgi:putative SOS response-associated peptidase YedK